MKEENREELQKKYIELQMLDAQMKQMHKQLDSSFYAIDLDLVLIDRHRIIAFLDFKKTTDLLTWAEAIAYNRLADVAPVYIISSDNPNAGPFFIRRFMHGYEDETIPDWKGLEAWERKLRNRGGEP